jgi:hypothetical protein
MTVGGTRKPSSRTAGAHGRRFKRRELMVADGGKLILNVDGSIRLIDAEGHTRPDEPEWARCAIRFGLRPQSSTIAPTGRYVDATKPPRR